MTVDVIKWSNTDEKRKQELLARTELDITGYTNSVAPILDEIKQEGDRAVIKYIEKFNAVLFKPDQIRVSEREFEEADRSLSDELKTALRENIKNVETFHRHQIPGPASFSEIAPGIFAGEKAEPIPSVGIYVPRGKGSFPSMLYMQAVPAKVAGVPQIIIATPPDERGKADDATLFVARECGVREVYKISGVQAIGALAYGTEHIPKVKKIIGPGSGYVTAAKRLLYGVVDVGLPAGPSEAIILADETADPEKAAYDLLIEAEHGPDSAAILATDSPELAKETAGIVQNRIPQVPEPRQSYLKDTFQTYSGIILFDSFGEAVDFTNEYAPEHLQILSRDPFEIMPRIKNAGEILLGDYLPSSLANFSVGINAVLPTGGFAATFSAVSVRDFIKHISIAYATKSGYNTIARSAITVAEYEGFPSHAAALKLRFKKEN
jgi:histidinol dehydrogenase